MRRSLHPAVWVLSYLVLTLSLGVGPRSACAAEPAAAKAVPPASVVNDPKSLDELKALQQRIEKVVAKVLPCTVGVRVGPAAGSGVIVSPDGLVMTAGHVVGKPGQPVVFLFADGKTAKGKTLGMYSSADAGLMQITDPGKWPCAEKGTSANVLPGAWCIATGHPLGYQQGRPPVVRVGRVLRNRDGVIQTDCALVGGDSGGPLFDLDGKIIGIHSRIGTTLDTNLHVPVDVFTENWDRLVKGDSWQDVAPHRESPALKNLFRTLLVDARRCTVRVKSDGQEVALGTIVGPDGWIVSKASELKGKIACRLSDGREFDARLVGISEPYDLAMLKIDTAGLPAIGWSKQVPAVGQWLAAPEAADDALAIGVMSVPLRRIPPMSGVLGVQLKIDDPNGPARIEKVTPGSPAEQAGLKDGDIITHVDGKPTKNSADLMAAVRQHRPGEHLRLNVKRGDQVLAIPVKLAVLDTPGSQKRDWQNRSGVGISKRHDDFPSVLQHDVVLRPIDCGGPLVDLSGKVVGVNIARGGRTETYSIPTEVMLGLMYDLMSGRLNPLTIAAEKAAIEKAKADKAAAEKAALEKKIAEQKAAAEKVAKAEAEKKAAAEKAAKDKAEADKKAAAEKAAAEKAAKDKVEADKKAAAEKAAAEKAAKDKAEAEKKAAAEKAAKDKAEADKQAAEKAAKEKAAAEKKPAEQKK